MAVVSLTIAGLTVVALSSPAGAVQTLARASLQDADGVEIGKVVFKGIGKYAERVEVDIVAPAAPNRGGFHGFHIHSVGVCDRTLSGVPLMPFRSAGGHFNLDPLALHGAHTGDLPSVLLTDQGESYAEFETERFDVSTLFDADGSAVVLHAGPDNFNNIPTDYLWQGTTAPGAPATGDAGDRYACGVVERI